MFTYCFIDNYGLKTPADIALKKDMEYLLSKVESGEFKELQIINDNPINAEA